MKFFVSTLLSFIFFAHLLAQSNVMVEGYAYEQKNRGYLNQVEISISELKTGQEIFSGYTNVEGYFSCNVPADNKFIISAKKQAFHTLVQDFSTKNLSDPKVFLSLEMEREPGYIFEGTLAPTRESEQPVDAIIGAKIEIYNNSTEKQEVLIPSATSYTFSHPLIPGNHYTFLIRKEGFYNKRIEAYVDVAGCILCFEGTGEIRPGVVDNLTDGLTKGSLISNIEMEPIELGKGIVIPDIFYDYDKADLRPKSKSILDNLITLLKNNPALIVEMGSHTDSRGTVEYNRELSQRRAKSVVDYLINVGKIPSMRLSAFGYGESELKNHCADGVICNEVEHQLNRRTEMKVVGVLDFDPFRDLTLEQIILKEKSDVILDQMIAGKSEQIRATNFDDLPEEVKRDILRSQGGQENDAPSEVKVEAVPEPTPSTEKPEMEQSNEIEPNQGQNRIVPFPEDFSGHSVYLGQLPGPVVVIEKGLTDKHGKIYKSEDGRYFLGTFDSKKKAKKYLKSLLPMYPGAKTESIK